VVRQRQKGLAFTANFAISLPYRKCPFAGHSQTSYTNVRLCFAYTEVE
jgi:hypothetical protein